MKTALLILMLSLSLSGCALLYSYSDNLPQRIDDWTAAKKYSVALNTISYIKPNHKDYRILQRKKKKLERDMTYYETSSIVQSKNLSAKGEWIKAFKLIDEVTSNIINTDNIKKHRAILLIKRNKIISSYENDVLYTKARNLAEKMPLYKKINKTVLTNEKNQLDVTEFNHSRKETTLRLAQRCEQQYRNSLYDDALTTIDLALKLNPEDEIIKKLSLIKSRIKEESKLIKASYVKKAKILLSKLSQGYSHLILKNTKDTIKSLTKYKESTNFKLVESLRKHLAAGVKQRFEAARNLYSKGKTQEALSIWLELRELAPDNPKLQSHIERAEKVLSKLKKLSNKPVKKK